MCQGSKHWGVTMWRQTHSEIQQSGADLGDINASESMHRRRHGRKETSHFRRSAVIAEHHDLFRLGQRRRHLSCNLITHNSSFRSATNTLTCNRTVLNACAWQFFWPDPGLFIGMTPMLMSSSSCYWWNIGMHICQCLAMTKSILWLSSYVLSRTSLLARWCMCQCMYVFFLFLLWRVSE